MAADMPRKAYRYTCNIVRPQAYSEGTIYESLMNAISDVVPQAYIGNQKPDDKEKILWVRFENTDCSDVFKNPDLFKSDAKGLPLLLILGYSNGVQIWLVSVNGEAQELLSIRQGPVKMLRVLPNPESVMGYSDSFSKQRPLVVMCDSSGAGQPYCGVKFVSLKTGDEVHNISFNTLTIQGVECNKRFVVVTFFKQCCVYEACQFNQLFWITSCYPCAGPTVNPIALSTRWLAYADKRLVPMHQSCGGMSGDGAQSYAATVISAAKGAFKGLSKFGETMMNTVTGTKPGGARRPDPEPELDNSDRPGIISVIDVQSVYKDRFNVIDDNEVGGLIAHFHAHANEPVAHMAFDPSGTMLVTACKLGHNFHIFRLMAHPCSSSLGAVHHLYTLYRGDTTAKVVDISFSHDSRWVTVSTHRGTTHLFPITPYGGPVNMRTHCQPCVVNRASRFQKSAGLEDIEHSLRGRQSPILSTSPGGSGTQHRQYDRYPKLIQQNTLNNNMGNPRLPPYPHPTTIYPAYQVKQSSGPSLNSVTSSPSHSATGQDHTCCVAARFCSPRLCVVGSPRQGVDRRDGGKRPVDSLFIMTQSGYLIEYVLEPKPLPVHDKVTDSSSLDLHVTGRIQWCLQRWRTSAELRPPLPSNSPLILAHEAVMSQVATAPDLSDLPGITRQDSKDSLSSDHSGKDDNDELWLPQIEIMTHVGPHRRLWMGPQFSFKTYSENTTILSSNSPALLSPCPDTQQAMDLAGDEGDLESLKLQPTRSNPVSMPNARPAYRRLSGDNSPSPGPGRQGASVMIIEAGSYEHSPHLQDVYTNWAESTVVKEPRGSDDTEEDRIKETLADAMVESPIKDMEKMSLRQEIPRTDVAVGKEKSQMETRKSGRERRDTKKEGSGGGSCSRAEGKLTEDSQKVSPAKIESHSSVKGSKSSESKMKDEGTQANDSGGGSSRTEGKLTKDSQKVLPGKTETHSSPVKGNNKAESKMKDEAKTKSGCSLVKGSKISELKMKDEAKTKSGCSPVKGSKSSESKMKDEAKTKSGCSPVKGSKSLESKMKDEGKQAKESFETMKSVMENVSVAGPPTVSSQTPSVGVQQMEMNLPSMESNSEVCTSNNTSPEVCTSDKSLSSSASEIAISFNSLSSSFSDLKSSPEVSTDKKERGSRKGISHTERSPKTAGFADTESSPDAGFSYSTPKPKCASFAEERAQESSESSFETISTMEDVEKKSIVGKKSTSSKSKARNVSSESKTCEEEKVQEGSSESSFETIPAHDIAESRDTFARTLEDDEKKSMVGKKSTPSKSKASIAEEKAQEVSSEKSTPSKSSESSFETISTHDIAESKDTCARMLEDDEKKSIVGKKSTSSKSKASIAEEKAQEVSSEKSTPSKSPESSFETISTLEAVSENTFARTLEDVEKKSITSKMSTPSKSKARNVSVESKRGEETSSSDPIAEKETQSAKDKQKNKGRKSKNKKNKNANSVEDVSTSECENQGKHEKDVLSFTVHHYAKEQSSNKGKIESVDEKCTETSKVMSPIEKVSENSEAFEEFSTPGSEHLDTNMEGWMSGLPSDKDDKLLTEQETDRCMEVPHEVETVSECAATLDSKTDEGKSEMESIPLCMLQSIYEEAIDDTVVVPDMPIQDTHGKTYVEGKETELLKKQDTEESVYFEAVENPKPELSCQIQEVHDDILSRMKKAILEEQLKSENEPEHLQSDNTTMESTAAQTQVKAKKPLGVRHFSDAIKQVEEDPTAWENATAEKTVEDNQSGSCESMKEIKQKESAKGLNFEFKIPLTKKTPTKSERRTQVSSNVGVGVMTKDDDAETTNMGSKQEVVAAAAKPKVAVEKIDMDRKAPSISVPLEEIPKDATTSVQIKTSKSPRKSNLKDNTASLSGKLETHVSNTEKCSGEEASISTAKDSKLKELHDPLVQDESARQKSTPAEVAVGSTVEDDRESVRQKSTPVEVAAGSTVEDDREARDKDLLSGTSSTAGASGRSSEERGEKEDTSKASTSSKRKKKKKNRK